jgi:indolepyruvate ferredoxin oxidoreductase beta subunit
MMVEEHNILISSVGGQGGKTLARILSNAAMEMGFNVRAGETLGMAQRGGSASSHVRIGSQVYGPSISRGGADVVLSLEPAEALKAIEYIGRQTKVIVNTVPTVPSSVVLGQSKYPKLEDIMATLKEATDEVYTLDATGLAREAGTTRSLNVVALGAYMALGEGVLTLDSVKTVIAASVPVRYLEQNMKAFELGLTRMKKIISGV